MALPTLFLPHGGGPCFFMEWPFGPPDTWEPLAAWLRALPDALPQPEALLVVSAHWEAPEVRILAAPNPTLLYDYSGFPPHTYELTWPAPGHPALATKTARERRSPAPGTRKRVSPASQRGRLQGSQRSAPGAPRAAVTNQSGSSVPIDR